MGRIKKAPEEVSESRAMAAKARWDEGKSYVYFVRVGPYIKIGTSTNPQSRLGGLRSAGLTRPDDLPKVRSEWIGLMPGGHKKEREIHSLFSDLRVQGTREWYRVHESILRFASQPKDELKTALRRIARNALIRARARAAVSQAQRELSE